MTELSPTARLAGSASYESGVDWLLDYFRDEGFAQPSARVLSFCWHPLSIPIETPTKGRGGWGCSRMTELSPTARLCRHCAGDGPRLHRGGDGAALGPGSRTRDAAGAGAGDDWGHYPSW